MVPGIEKRKLRKADISDTFSGLKDLILLGDYIQPMDTSATIKLTFKNIKNRDAFPIPAL